MVKGIAFTFDKLEKVVIFDCEVENHPVNVNPIITLFHVFLHRNPSAVDTCCALSKAKDMFSFSR